MLLIQEKLRSLKGNYKDRISYVEHTHGLDTSINEELGLCIFNYNQIESVKSDKLAQQCRGLILELDSWNVVARSFDRFFNYGECLDLQKDFDWSNYFCNEKIDGSLMSLWYHKGKWFVSTRGSFADQKPNGAPLTWEEMFWQAFGNKEKLKLLNPEYTYVFEFVSPYTKVVREYPNIDIFLLTVVDNKYGELSPARVNFISSQYGFKRPQTYIFKSPKEILDWLDCNSEFDQTFEGFVLRDNAGLRLKIKGKKYLELHRLRGNGNCFTYKSLIPFVFDGEESELLVYFKEAQPILDELKVRVNELIDEAMIVWNSAKDEQYQKNFALAIKGRTPLGSVLFTARKLGVCPSTLFANETELFLKILKGE